MKTQPLIIIVHLILGFLIPVIGQEETHALSFKISVNEQVRPSFKSKGRLFIFVSTNPDVEPRTLTWPTRIDDEFHLFARSFPRWNADETLVVDQPEDWDSWAKYRKCTFNEVPGGTYYIQLLWDQDFEGFGVNAPGNLYSPKQEIQLSASRTISLELSEIIQPFVLQEHDYMKLITHQSDTLSRYFGKPVYERAVILFPSGYNESPDKEYPIRYNIIGGMGELDMLNGLINDKEFFNWWLSGEAPQIITVYLERGFNGNCYHVDSDCLGPFGYSLIHEFIPYIEKEYRGTDAPETRFVDGCSTGGWSSLALQLFYPETFSGTFSYSPDPVAFWKFQSVNIYGDKNMFYNKYGYQNPVRLTPWNSTNISVKDWVAFENILGYSGTYIDSDLMFGTWTAMFSPKGPDDRPIPLFDPYTGTIDTTHNRKVIKKWGRYDLSGYLRYTWKNLGPRLQGKIYIWTGGRDAWGSSTAVEELQWMMNNRLEDPVPDVIFDQDYTGGHCEAFSDRRVLEQIAEKLVQTP